MSREVMMPSPKDGTAGKLVSPVAPRKALEADNADAGDVAKAKAEQQQAGEGKYGSTPVKPYKPAANQGGAGGNSGAASAAPAKPKPTNWIEISLVDLEGEPVAGEPYKIMLPDGQTVAEGTTDEKGGARVDGIDPGTCKVTFPNRDSRSWKSA
jgi:type VI secretion system secreted protein VgrG